MNFSFPDNKTITNGVLKNFKKEGGRFSFFDLDIEQPLDNIIEINGTDYIFTYLDGAFSGNKGGNSIILKLFNAQEFDIDEIEYGEPDLILKISKSKKALKQEWIKKSEKRFSKEIKALKDCQEKTFQNIINIYHDGVCSIRNFQNNRFEQHLYYTMEYARYDLKTYIEANHSTLTIDNKISLCLSICTGLNELYSLGYYHRDIKPDNIFIVGAEWKIGDLGLIQERKSDNAIDEVAEFIGPRGWLSPEAMNKFLCEGKKFKFSHDCFIDHQSDIFQLGKVFWYIFQHNVPIGEVKEDDFLIKSSSVFPILKRMLRYSKKSRFKEVNEIIKLFKLIEQQLLKKAA